MRYKSLGKTGLLISELGFGGAGLGNLFYAYPNETLNRAIDAAFQMGIRYFDTAPEYGHGLSERRLGDALRQKHDASWILSTKAGERLIHNPSKPPPKNHFVDKLPFHLEYDYSYDAILRGFEDSLQRLGLNRIDILLIHDLDPIIHGNKFKKYFNQFKNHGYKALQFLREQKLVKAIGLGVKCWEVCAEVLNFLAIDCCMLQGNYTLLEQVLPNSFLNQCLTDNVAILIAGPFASGILATGSMSKGFFHHKPASADILQKVKAFENVCADFNIDLKTAALQFPLKHPAITSVVVGLVTEEMVIDAHQSYHESLPNEFWDVLMNKQLIKELQS